MLIASVMFAASLGIPTLSATPALADITGPATKTDGDSINIDGQRIRIHGIDAPEEKQSCTYTNGEEWPCGSVATAFMSHTLSPTKWWRVSSATWAVMGVSWLSAMQAERTLAGPWCTTVWRSLIGASASSMWPPRTAPERRGGVCGRGSLSSPGSGGRRRGNELRAQNIRRFPVPGKVYY